MLSNTPRIPLFKYGTDYGGWYFPEASLTEQDIIISAGAGEDISFDIELVNRFNCYIHILDPTPRALTHYNNTKLLISEGKKAPINFSKTDFYQTDIDIYNRMMFYPVGLLNKNKTVFFYEPANKDFVSHSVGNRHNTKDGFKAPCLRLDKFLKNMQINTIKAIKMDIEGAEYGIIRDMLASKIRPDYLLIEFHTGNTLLEKLLSNNRILHCLMLRVAGYCIVSRRGNDFTFEKQSP